MLLVPRSGGGRQSSDGSPRIIVIDRQRLFLDGMAKLLAADPIHASVVVFSDSEVGVEVAVESAPDLVLCDVNAAPEPGDAVARRLQAAGIPVILMGEADETTSLIEAMRLAANGYLTKDVTVDEFVASVNAVLAGHAVVSTTLASDYYSRGTTAAMAPSVTAPPLSPAEMDILRMVGRALSVDAIASARGSSKKTVRNHLASIYRKLDVRNRSEAVLVAARLGLAESA